MSDLREYIWKKQYAQGNESIEQGFRRVAENIALAEPIDKREEAIEAFFEMMQSNKFIPGGRILAGAGSAHGNNLNCLHGDTLVQTREGVFPIRALVGQKHQVLTRNDTWRWAEFREFGQQELYRVVFSNGEEVLATANHRWYTRKGVYTTQQLVNKRIPVMATYIRPPRNDDYYQGVRHGLVYGDGSKNSTSYTYGLRLFGIKQSLAQMFDSYAKITEKQYGGREQTVVTVIGGHYKELPPANASDSYWYGFFCGLLAVDGCVDELGSVIIHSADKEALQTIAKRLKHFGIAYASLKCTRELSPYDGSHKPVYGLRLFRRTLMPEDFLREDHRRRFVDKSQSGKHSSLKVVAVESTGLTETVYCAVEPETHSFVLAGGILTGNCFVVDGAPEPPGSNDWALLLAKKLALITKVGGGTGLNLDPIPPRRNFLQQTGSLYIYINPNHPNSDDVYTGRITQRFTGLKIEQGYKVAGILTKVKDAPQRAEWLLVEDSIESIWDNAAQMVKLMLDGKDVVVCLDALRPEGAWVNGSGGESSGPASFAVEIFDNYARWAMRGGAEYAGPVATLRYLYAPTLRVIKQGGTRRGAGMATLSIHHPDINDFITCKDLDRENAEGDISTFNISVLVDNKTIENYQNNESTACALLQAIAEHAHATGEPGVLFVDTINANNPLAAIDGPIVATNPCFVGETRIPTEFGLVPIEQLVDKESFKLVTDNRAPLFGLGQPNESLGVTVRGNVRAFYTGEREVIRVETKEGFTLTLTPDHKLLTPSGYRKAGDLQPGDKLFVQSGEGLWSQDKALPAETLNFIAERLPKAGGKHSSGRRDIREQYANLPTEWSEELGLALGWLIGDGFVRKDGVGLYFSNKEFADAQTVVSSLRKWFGQGYLTATNFNTQYLRFGKLPAEFFMTLGVKPVKATDKQVPESIFTAPREAVRGFLRGLFSTDGTVEGGVHKGTCSVRLASSSKKLLEGVQLLLLNFGIFGPIYHRRAAQRKALPDGKGGLKEYSVADQYELIIGGKSRDRFAEVIGFALPHKQAKLEEFVCFNKNKQRKFRRQSFEATITKIEPVGVAKVYDLTEPIGHSLVANGVVAHNCAEITLYPGEPCDLGAINFSEFVKDGAIDYEGLAQTAKLAVRFLDDVLTVEKAPLKEITAAIEDKRRIGLGLMGLADALIKLGIAYDSEEGRKVAASMFDAVVKAGLQASKDLAVERGVPDGVRRAGLARRNIALFTVAPTGTTSMLAGVSSGVEPVFAAAYDRRIDTEVHKVLHPLLVKMLNEQNALEWARQANVPTVKDGQWNLELIIEGINKAHGSVQPFVERGWLPPWFACFKIAHDITPKDHVLMQAAIQRVMDQEMAGNSISKTINLPNHASVEDVLSAYVLAHKEGCKGCTVYRDGSRAFQVLSVEDGDFESWAKQFETVSAKPNDNNATFVSALRTRPRVIQSLTHKYEVGGRKIYVTVGWNEKGEIVEAFINLSKPTPNEAVIADLVGRLLSVAFKHGAEVKDVVKHLQGHYDQSGGFSEGMGFVNSMWDVVAHALLNTGPNSETKNILINAPRTDSCPECGGPLVRKGGCNKCEKCGYETCG
jgi:ribonucleoside-diphosphate reductase alpha chain